MDKPFTVGDVAFLRAMLDRDVDPVHQARADALLDSLERGILDTARLIESIGRGRTEFRLRVAPELAEDKMKCLDCKESPTGRCVKHRPEEITMRYPEAVATEWPSRWQFTNAVHYMTCPRCQAEPGFYCVRPSGQNGYCHGERLKALNEQRPEIAAMSRVLMTKSPGGK